MIQWLRHHWRDVMARLPLPTLALAASYGVYSYALLFVPQWVAIVQAAAFELTYLGLSTVDVPERWRRRRAAAISLAAVSVSVVYNSAAGYFHRNPAALIGLSFAEELGLAVAHGAPLAIVAYLVADLLLHTFNPRAIPAQRRALIRKLARLLRESRGLVATLRTQIDLVRGELEHLRASAEGQCAQSTEEAARLRGEVERLRAALAAPPPPAVPTLAAVVAYARSAVQNDRSLADVARETGFRESTLRDWMRATTNGVEVLN